MNVSVHIACNDHRNGEFSGRFGDLAVDVGRETAIRLEYGDALRCKIHGGSLLVQYPLDTPESAASAHVIERYPIRSHNVWVGNWCWDAVGMDVSDACRLLNRLRGEGWSCTEAWEGLYAAWEEGRDITPEMLKGDG